MAEQTAGTAVIRIRLDTAGASKELDGLFRPRGGGAGGGSVPGLAPGGGPPNVSSTGRAGGGVLSGLNLTRLAGFGVGAAFAAPIVGDAASFVGSTVGGYGRLASEAMGLGGMARSARVPEQATRDTISQLGAAGMFASPDQIRALRDVNKRMRDLEADAETRIRASVGGDQAKDITALMRTALEMFIKHWPEVVAVLVARGLLKSAPGVVGKIARII